MKTEIALKDITLELDGAEGGKIWIYGTDGEMCYIKCDELQQVIDFLSDIINFKKKKGK